MVLSVFFWGGGQGRFLGRCIKTSLKCQIQYLNLIRDWSLITERGGATKREGRAREVLPLRKRGAEKVLAMLKGAHTKCFGVVLRCSLKF